MKQQRSLGVFNQLFRTLWPAAQHLPSQSVASGGKDSDAMLRHLVALHRSHQRTGELFALTADLGRIEWPRTIEHIRALCTQLKIKLVVVRRQKGGMIDRWDERRQVLIEQQVAIAPEEVSTAEKAIAPGKEGDKPFWSSSAARYCTKELKTALPSAE